MFSPKNKKHSLLRMLLNGISCDQIHQKEYFTRKLAMLYINRLQA
ncbi:hypothetical protein SPONN_2371 [uncultured Candidatus Thioglobus sp.]|nr:hypothetical protein SPONN_2371 [uncultured Candidatus Thioglobus sp.]